MIWNERKCLERVAAVGLPHVCKLHGCFRNGNSLFFVLEFIEGSPLYRRVRRLGGLDIEETRWTIFRATEILNSLHDVGIVHRDVKGSNIMQKPDGDLVLVDFSFATALDPGRPLPSAYCGTPHAMAPEVHSCDPSGERGSSRGYSFPVDWWSLGILGFEVYYNVPPFGYRDYEVHRQKTIAQLCRESPASLIFPKDPAAPEEYKRLIRGLLQAAEKRRYGYAEVKRSKWMRGVELPPSSRMCEPLDVDLKTKDLEEAWHAEGHEGVQDYLAEKRRMHLFDLNVPLQ
eukprot:Polyplicarium_translucidae@DN3477_c0_g1_i2.p1